jgi:hypothetical protein
MELRYIHDYNAIIINMDETMIRFHEPTNRTNSLRGQKQVCNNNTDVVKKDVSIILAVNGAGEMLPVFIIFKEKGWKFGTSVPQRLNASLPMNV